VPFELADDRQDGVGRERRAALRVVSIDGLDERQARDLLEVLLRLRGVAVARGEVARQLQMALDQFRSQRCVAACAEFGEERLEGVVAASQGTDDRRGVRRERASKRVGVCS
jgi:hypothetical protein